MKNIMYYYNFCLLQNPVYRVSLILFVTCISFLMVPSHVVLLDNFDYQYYFYLSQSENVELQTQIDTLTETNAQLTDLIIDQNISYHKMFETNKTLFDENVELTQKLACNRYLVFVATIFIVSLYFYGINFPK